MLSATYIKKSGERWEFQRNGSNGNGVWYDFGLSSYTQENGKKFSVYSETLFQSTYNTNYKRITSIESPDGYLAKYLYETDWSIASTGLSSPSKIKLYNIAETYCPRDANSCASPALNEISAQRSGDFFTSTRTVMTGDSRTWTYNFGSNFILSSVRFPGSNADDITYQSSNGSQIVTYHGQQWTYSAPSAPSGYFKTTVTDPAGLQKTYTFSSSTNKLASFTNQLGRTSTYERDTQGRLTKAIGPDGDYIQLAYDDRGNRFSTYRSPKTGSILSSITTSATFPLTCDNVVTCDKPTSTTDERGGVTDYTYDPNHGNLLTVTLPAPSPGAPRPQTRYTYSLLNAWVKDASSNLVQSPAGVYKLTGVSQCRTLSSCAGTADEVVTSIAYQAGSSSQGSNLLPATTSAGDGSLTATSAMTYDSVGNPQTLDGPLAGSADTTRYRYDTARRVVGVVSPDPDGSGSLKHRAVRITYNAKEQVALIEQGNVNSQSDSDWSTMTVSQQIIPSYDATTRNKTLDVASAGGTAFAATQYSYDAYGRPDCVAQRMNPAIFGSLPTSACTLGASGSFGPDRIAKTVYNSSGQVEKQRQGVGTGTPIDEATYAYTADGQTGSVTDANGNKTTYEYDGFGRLAKQRYPSPTTPGTSSTTDYDQPTYDAAGNVTQLRLRDGQTISLTYDALNRVVLKDVPNTVAGELDVATTYDNLNRPLTISTSADTITYAYDGLGRKSSETGFAGQKTFQYDLAGRQTRLTWPGGSLYADYDYLVTGEVAKIRENGATSGAGVLATYAYDNLGRRTGVTRGNGTSTSYGFDAMSRLTSLSHDLASTTNDVATTFGYNPASEIVSQTRNNDAYAWPGRVNVNRGYTNNGLNQHTTSGANTLTYDGRGNLASAQGTSYGYTSENRLATAGGVSLTYDPAGRLKQVVGSSSTRFDYTGDALIAELDGSNVVLRRYVPGPGQDEPIVWYEGSGLTNRRWLHADERGSVTAITDASGAAIQLNSYDEYGIPASTNLGRFQYTGQTFLPEIGMYYYKARIYSPTLGRFLQTDPIGYGDGLNMYAYVGNNPVNRTDPTGLNEIICAPTNHVGGFGCITVTGSPPSAPASIPFYIFSQSTFSSNPDVPAWFGTKHYDPMADDDSQDEDIVVEARRSDPVKGIGMTARDKAMFDCLAYGCTVKEWTTMPQDPTFGGMIPPEKLRTSRGTPGEEEKILKAREAAKRALDKKPPVRAGWKGTLYLILELLSKFVK